MNPPTNHIVMFSGGVGSWATAQRVAQKHGTTNLTLLTANTNTESKDWLPFVNAAAKQTGGKLIILNNNGQNIWDIFKRERFIGNSRIDTCSKYLKRLPLREWIETNCNPANTTIHLGFDWTEEHRLTRSHPYWMSRTDYTQHLTKTNQDPQKARSVPAHWSTWDIDAPLTRPPYQDKADLIKELKQHNIPIPALYQQGFPHNNCAGACVKAGQAQWRKLLFADPDTYAWHEAKENEFREWIEKDVAILRHRSGPKTGEPLTLTEFRERQTASALFDETGEATYDTTDWGSCSCLMEPTETGVSLEASTSYKSGSYSGA